MLPSGHKTELGSVHQQPDLAVSTPIHTRSGREGEWGRASVEKADVVQQSHELAVWDTRDCRMSGHWQSPGLPWALEKRMQMGSRLLGKPGGQTAGSLVSSGFPTG